MSETEWMDDNCVQPVRETQPKAAQEWTLEAIPKWPGVVYVKLGDKYIASLYEQEAIRLVEAIKAAIAAEREKVKQQTKVYEKFIRELSDEVKQLRKQLAALEGVLADDNALKRIRQFVHDWDELGIISEIDAALAKVKEGKS